MYMCTCNITHLNLIIGIPDRDPSATAAVKLVTKPGVVSIDGSQWICTRNKKEKVKYLAGQEKGSMVGGVLSSNIVIRKVDPQTRPACNPFSTLYQSSTHLNPVKDLIVGKSLVTKLSSEFRHVTGGRKLLFLTGSRSVSLPFPPSLHQGQRIYFWGLQSKVHTD